MKSGNPQVTAAAAGEERRGTRIQSVARGCTLLMWLAEQGRGATAKEIAFANRLALATTYHLLNTLVAQGLLAKDERRRYVLGQGTATLVQAYLRGAAVSAPMLDAMRDLAARAQTAAYLADWGERQMRMLASVERPGLPSVADVSSGPLRDAHARANGKVLLAYAPPELRDTYLGSQPLRRLTPATLCDFDALDSELARVRERACAYDDQEYRVGVSCIAAPVFSDGKVVAVCGVSVPAERLEARRDELTAIVCDVARSVPSRA
jgi:DNA-binding IclR family transcriptional regulator